MIESLHVLGRDEAETLGAVEELDCFGDPDGGKPLALCVK
jgi:hypothetical protein